MSTFVANPPSSHIFESLVPYYAEALLGAQNNNTAGEEISHPNGHSVTNGVWVLLVGTLLWSYILLVILAKKPKCDCTARLDGKTVVITGATDGVGKATAFELASRGAEIVIPCRNAEKGRRVAREIADITGNHKIQVVYVDFTNLESVKVCTQILKKSLKKVDILINNAGIGNGVGTTLDGFPLVFGVNHLAPFLFTTELLPLLRKAPTARIVCVSSVTHLWGNINFDELQDLDGGSLPSQFRAYSRSKLANVLFAKQLHRNESQHGISTYIAHPGWTFTAIFRDSPVLAKLLLFPLLYLFLYTPAQGAQTQIHLALAPGIESSSGNYFVSCKPARTGKSAKDIELASNLWSYSEKAVASALNQSVGYCTSI
uniref:retinol dehydrogenase 11-like n=1 Tax=Ciona intestinalis TaxID=7719 RepID=UPI0005218577|nr:retinol dehydrogenase 11-like [Ciona intestinalis]|eukprot:XP_026690134.1 retinol dehydrogenase 11-like [Ciona intestinalis]